MKIYPLEVYMFHAYALSSSIPFSPSPSLSSYSSWVLLHMNIAIYCTKLVEVSWTQLLNLVIWAVRGDLVLFGLPLLHIYCLSSCSYLYGECLYIHQKRRKKKKEKLEKRRWMVRSIWWSYLLHVKRGPFLSLSTETSTCHWTPLGWEGPVFGHPLAWENFQCPVNNLHITLIMYMIKMTFYTHKIKHSKHL